MKAKTIFIVFLSCIIGYLFYDYLFKEYNDMTIPVSGGSETRELYFLQYGAYSTYENMINATKNLSQYIYINDERYYYAFVCITENSENVEKIKGFYEQMGYILYSKKISVTADNFFIPLSQYDLLLKETKELTTIPTICSQGLELYEEVVLSDN